MDADFGGGFTVPPQSVVTCLSRVPQYLDLFTVGRDSAVYTTFFDVNGGWPDAWFRLADPRFADGFTVPARSAVSCLSRSGDHLDLFVVGFDGGVYSTFWDASTGWLNQWFRLVDPNFGDSFTVPPGSPVSCLSRLSRYQDHMDLFVVGHDGAIYSTFWDASTGWGRSLVPGLRRNNACWPGRLRPGQQAARPVRVLNRPPSRGHSELTFLALTVSPTPALRRALASRPRRLPSRRGGNLRRGFQAGRG